MSKFYKISNDSVFKSIFTKVRNRDLLERMIKVVINENVEIERLLPVEQAKDSIQVKGKTLDILAKCRGKEINMEINTNEYYGLHRRNAAYIFKRYTNSVSVGKDYNEMPKFIQINFTKSDREDLPLISCYTLYDKENNQEFIDNLIIYEINIQKAKEMWYDEKDGRELIALLDCDKEELDSIKGDEYVEKLKREVNKLNQDKDFVEFLSKEDEERLLINTLKNNSYKDGLKTGIEQGTIDIAKNMLSKGTDINYISEVTRLSINQIKDLSIDQIERLNN